MSTCSNTTNNNPNEGYSQPPPPELATPTEQAIWRNAPDKPAEQTANNLILKKPLGEIKEFLVRVRVRVGLSLSHSHSRPDQGEGQGHSHTHRHRRGRGGSRAVYLVLLMLVLLSLLLTSCSSSDILGDQSADQSQSASNQDSPKLTLQPTDFGGGDIGKTINNILITIATAPASFLGNLSLTSLDWLLHFSQSVKFDYPAGQRVCGFTGGGSWDNPTTNSGGVSLQPLTQCATQVYDGMKFMPISLLLLAIFPFLLKYVVGGFLGGGGSLTDFFVKGIAVILFSINMDTIMTLLVALPMRLFFYILQVNTGTGSTTATTGQAASGSSQQDAWIKQLTDGFAPLFKLDQSVHNNNLPFAWLISILAIITALAILAIGLAFLVRSFLLIFWFILSPLSLSSLLLEETSGFFYAWQGRVLAQVVSILPLAVVLRIAVVLEGAFPSFKTDVFSLLVLMASEAILLGISLVMAWKFLTGEMKQHLQLAGQGFGLARSLVSGSLRAAGGALTAPYRAARYGYRKADAVGEALLGTATYTDDGTERSTGYLGGLLPGVGPWRTIDKRSSGGGSGAGVGAVQSSTSAASLESAGGAEVEYGSSSPQYSWPQVGAGAGSSGGGGGMMGGGSSDYNEMAQAMRGMMSSLQLSSLGGVGRMAPPPPPRPALTSGGAGNGGSGPARSNQTMLLPSRGGAGASKTGQNGPEMGVVGLNTAAATTGSNNERQTQLLSDALNYGGAGGFGTTNADAFYYGGNSNSNSGSAASNSGAGYYGGNGGGGLAPVNNPTQSYDAGEAGSDGGNSWDAASSLATLAANSQIIDPATGKRLDFGQVLPALAGMNGPGSPATNPSPVAANSGTSSVQAPAPTRPAITARPAQRLNGGQGADNGIAVSDTQLTPQLGSYSAPTQPLIGSNSSSGVSGLADNFGAGMPPVAPAPSATSSMTPGPLAAPLPVVVPPPPPPPPLPQTQTQAQTELTAAGGEVVSSVAAPSIQPTPASPSVVVAPVAPATITPPPLPATPTPPVSSGPIRVKNVMSNSPDQLIQPFPLNISGVSSGPVQPSSAAQPLPASSAGGVTPHWPGGGTGPSNSIGSAANSFSVPPAAGNGGMYEGLVNPSSSSATAPSAGFGTALPTIPPPPPMLSFTSPLPDTGAASGSGTGVGLPPTMGQPQQQPGSGSIPPNNAGNQGSGQPGGTGIGS